MQAVAIDGNASVGKYVGVLIAAQLGCGLLFEGLERFAGINTPNSIGIVGSVVGCLLAAQMFVRDHKRAPETREKHRFALWGTVMTLVSAAPIILLALAVDGVLGEAWQFLASLPAQAAANPGMTALIAAGVAVLCFISYGIDYWLFASFTKQQAAKARVP